MGADVKQTRRAVRGIGEVPALAGQGGEPEILQRRAAAVQQGSRRPAARDRHHQEPIRTSNTLVDTQFIKCDRRTRSCPQRDRRGSVRSRPPAADARGPDGAAMTPLAARPAAAARSRSASRSSSLFVAAWSVATFGGFVSKTFLADPLTMLREGWRAVRAVRLRQGRRRSRVARARRLRARRGRSRCRSASRWARTSRSRRSSSRSSRSRATCPRRRSFRC